MAYGIRNSGTADYHMNENCH